MRADVPSARSEMLSTCAYVRAERQTKTPSCLPLREVWRLGFVVYGPYVAQRHATASAVQKVEVIPQLVARAAIVRFEPSLHLGCAARECRGS